MSDCQTVKRIITINIEDADGVAIRVGSVLKRIDEDTSGVVTAIRKVGDRGTLFECEGDLIISIGPGQTRVTSKYNEWRHLKRADQTYEQRLLSWQQVAYDHDDESRVSRDEGVCIDGIMNLLPDDIVNLDYGPWPDSIDDALQFLVEHLNDLKKEARQ